MAIVYIVACLVASASSMAGLNWLASRKWEAAREQHWTERARLLYPVQISALLSLMMFTVAAMLLALGQPETRDLWTWFGAAGFVGALLGCYPLDRRILPEFTFRSWLAQTAIGWGTRIFVLAPFIIAVAIAPPEWNIRMATIAIVFALWHLWSCVGGLISLWTWLGILKPVPDSVRWLMQESFDRLSITPRSLLFFESPLLLAFALPFRSTLLFTRGLLDKCTPGELNAICLHELAHLKEDRRMLTQRVLSSFAIYPLIFVRPATATWGITGLIPLYGVMLSLVLIAKKVGRKAELRADQIAAEHQSNEGVYSQALLKLYSVNQAPAVMRGKRQIHPHLYDRMVAAGVMPDFNRPKTPAFASWTVLIPIALILGLGVRLQLLSR
jgi:Zn-dependent protease with chaperone function